jgi:heme-degrading monooxygenase HmoA
MSEKSRKIGKKEGNAMFARLTTINTRPERVDEGIAIYKKSVIPAAKSQKGFVAAYLLVDRPTGKGMSVTFWKTEEDALANERSHYYQEQLVKYLDLLVGATIREGYEVAVKG